MKRPINALVSSYDPEKFACITHLLEQTTDQIGILFRNLADAIPVSIEEVQTNVSAYVEQIAEDASSVFGVLAAQRMRSNLALSRHLTERSVRLSYFSVAKAIGLGYSESDATRTNRKVHN